MNYNYYEELYKGSKIELVGGPFCGDVTTFLKRPTSNILSVPVPNSNTHERYELESTRKAVWIGHKNAAA